jgi:hypothetical protein
LGGWAEEPELKTDNTTRIRTLDLKHLTPLSLHGAILRDVGVHFVITRETWFVLLNKLVE